MTIVSGAVTDQQLQAVLGRFAALADVLLRDPVAWLGQDGPQQGDQRAGRAGRLLNGLERDAGRVRRLVTGRVHPGSPDWSDLPLGDRTGWWVARIQAVAAPLAATPRVLGVLADRVPVQGALGSAAAGLAVCAVAKESGVGSPQDWVPLLGRVLFDRDLATPAQLPAVDDDDIPPDGPHEAAVPPPGPLRRAGRGLWRLARLLWGLPGLFDDRPRGAWVWRALGKVPVVGLPAGLLDERGAVRAAAEETRRVLQEGTPA